MGGLLCWPGGLGKKSYRREFGRHVGGKKIGMKRVQVGALNISTISNCTVFRCEAARDDQRSPKGLLWVETADFRVNIFGRFFVLFWLIGVAPGSLLLFLLLKAHT